MSETDTSGERFNDQNREILATTLSEEIPQGSLSDEDYEGTKQIQGNFIEMNEFLDKNCVPLNDVSKDRLLEIYNGMRNGQYRMTKYYMKETNHWMSQLCLGLCSLFSKKNDPAAPVNYWSIVWPAVGASVTFGAALVAGSIEANYRKRGGQQMSVILRKGPSDKYKKMYPGA